MKKENPFTTTFGIEPNEYISRTPNTSKIIDDFSAVSSPNQVYILTGVRGSGKSVTMAKIEDHFQNQSDWIVIELSTTWNMLVELATQLENSCSSLNISINFNTPIVSVSVSKDKEISTANLRIMKALEQLKNKHKRILIAVDEVVNNINVQQLTSAFQIYLRKKYPVYMIMTGLQENINNLQDENNLTFLHRAPTEDLIPLNRNAIASKYESIFSISKEQAYHMAQITKGYPYAFQVLGYLYWQQRDQKPFSEILNDMDDWLARYVYSKIWSELSQTDQKILTGIAKSNDSNVTNIRESLHMKPNEFSVYRKRLLNQQLVVTPSYGQIVLALPRFDIFIDNQYY